MTHLEALDLMFGLVKDTWDASSSVPNATGICWPDVAFTKPSSEWVRVTVVSGGGDQSSLADTTGQRKWDTTGTLYVECFSPIGIDPQRVIELASAFQAAFRAARHENLFYRRPKMVEAKPDGGYSKHIFMVDFEYTTVA